MQSLLSTLADYDPGLLAIIAHRWDVDLEAGDPRDAAERLSGVMLDPARAAAEWNRLADNERGALQTVLGTPGHRMAEAQFSRLFGEIRQMGPGRREREKPHLNPVSVAETLYFRGLLAVGFGQGRTGRQAFVYVPTDLAAVLPVHETGYDLVDEEPVARTSTGAFEPDAVFPATTMLVDDMTTLLSYLRIEQVPSERDELLGQVNDALTPYWLGEPDRGRVALLVSLAGSMGLAASEEGIFRPVPSHARHWLEQSRPRQVRALAEAWRDSTLFNDLWHTPGLQIEDTGWRNDPLLARQTILTFLEMVPPEDWWPRDELIAIVHEEEPDFQRPAADYDSWYIRDAQTGAPLRGFENWEQVDGAVLRFILTGPMHWLGLLDLGDEGTLCRLTVYGRALGGETEWPDPPEESEPPVIQPDGAILVGRTCNRYERFQVARITEWGPVDAPYIYTLSGAAFQHAQQQGIDADAIRAFLRRISEDNVPESVYRLLDRWTQGGSASVWMTRTVILRAKTEEDLQLILDTPELRRYLGARLGPKAVLVRADQEQELAHAIQDHGISIAFDD
ncbi:MAG: hypothetical protein GYB65_04965 [Chloroflexi bacterium]|nr:hypothetical protein [Chloroflexota bacterium]